MNRLRFLPILFLLLLRPAHADGVAANPRFVTVASGGKGGYIVRLPWAYDARFAAPVVVVVPAPGQKPVEAIRSDDWEAVADRWGIVLVAPAVADQEGIAALLAGVRRMVRIAPRRVCVYAGEQVMVLPVVADAQAVAARVPQALPMGGITRTLALTRRQSAREAWAFFDTPDMGDSALAADTPHRLTLVVTGLRDDRGQVAVPRSGIAAPSLGTATKPLSRRLRRLSAGMPR